MAPGKISISTYSAKKGKKKKTFPYDLEKSSRCNQETIQLNQWQQNSFSIWFNSKISDFAIMKFSFEQNKMKFYFISNFFFGKKNGNWIFIKNWITFEKVEY